MARRIKKSKAVVSAPRDPKLPTYEKALKAIEVAKNTDDVKKVRNVAEAMRAYAKQSRGHNNAG